MNKTIYTPFILALMVLSFSLSSHAQSNEQEQEFLEGVTKYVSVSCSELIMTRSSNSNKAKPSDEIHVDCDNVNLFKAVLYSSTENDRVYFKVFVFDPDLYEFVKIEPIQGFIFDKNAFNAKKLYQAIDNASLTLNEEKTQKRVRKTLTSEYRFYEKTQKK